jgi:hypothetical protein
VAQHGVAGGVAVGVVDLLEVVGVDRPPAPAAAGARLPALQFQLGRFEEGPPVGQAGEVVARTDAAQRLVGLAPLGDVAHDQAVGAVGRPVVPGLQVQRRDQAAAPEAAAVGAQRQPSSRLQPLAGRLRAAGRQALSARAGRPPGRTGPIVRLRPTRAAGRMPGEPPMLGVPAGDAPGASSDSRA